MVEGSPLEDRSVLLFLSSSVTGRELCDTSNKLLPCVARSNLINKRD